MDFQHGLLKKTFTSNLYIFKSGYTLFCLFIYYIILLKLRNSESNIAITCYPILTVCFNNIYTKNMKRYTQRIIE